MDRHGGRIHLIIGPMFARKTSTMIAEIERFIIAKRHCILVKFSGDTRYDHISGSNGIATHSGAIFDDVDVCTVSKLSDVNLEEYDDPDVIGISEGQFYPDLADVANEWANNGKIVIIEGLSGDSNQRPFEPISQVIPTADVITHLKAICTKCRDSDAAFTRRTVDNKEKILIGGADKYTACCRRCN